MARIRTIKPEFFCHSGLYDAETQSGLPLRVAFAGLWTVADRDGKFKWKPREIKLQVLPYDPVDMAEVLNALVLHAFVHRYTVNGEEFGLILKFKDHQHINPREAKSVIPDQRQMPDASLTREPSVNDDPLGGGNARVPDASLTREPRVPDVLPERENLDVHVQVGREGKGRELEEEGKKVPLPKEGNGCDAPPGDSGGLVEQPTGGNQPTPQPIPAKPKNPDDPWIAIYARGKVVLGRHAGGTITTLRKLYDDKPRKVLAKIEDAAEQREPARWLYAFLHSVDHKGKLAGVYIGGVPP